MQFMGCKAFCRSDKTVKKGLENGQITVRTTVIRKPPRRAEIIFPVCCSSQCRLLLYSPSKHDQIQPFSFVSYYYRYGKTLSPVFQKLEWGFYGSGMGFYGSALLPLIPARGAGLAAAAPVRSAERAACRCLPLSCAALLCACNRSADAAPICGNRATAAAAAGATTKGILCGAARPPPHPGGGGTLLRPGGRKLSGTPPRLEPGI